nr:hypothetical protein OG781_25395 [Streptomyces sp. NBC_00830]
MQARQLAERRGLRVVSFLLAAAGSGEEDALCPLGRSLPTVLINDMRDGRAAGMETSQRVNHRSGLFSQLLLVLLGLALLLLGYTLLRQNLPERLIHRWPWKLRILDVQSAVAAVLATGGAALARAQYARTVRPDPGYFGRVAADVAPRDQLAWVCHLFTGGQEGAATTGLSYRIADTAATHANGARDSSEWVDQQGAIASIEARGLLRHEDFLLNLIGHGPIPGQQPMFLGWFTEKAMLEVEDVFVRVRVLDRVGDTHERVIRLLKGANRSPTHPDPSPL